MSVSKCVHSIHNLFYDMESQSLLDPLNEAHIFALHYIYLPRIFTHRTIRHYCLTTYVKKLLYRQNRKKVQIYYCRYCLHGFIHIAIDVPQCKRARHAITLSMNCPKLKGSLHTPVVLTLLIASCIFHC